jgi:Domain of unknown function (DUF4375)
MTMPHLDRRKPQWLDGYSGQTTDGLLALEGTFRTDSIVHAFAQAIGEKATRLGDVHLSPPERVVLAVEAVEDRVNSGGFDSLLRYESARVQEVVPSLVAIGADGVADLARAAIDALHIDGPITARAIESAMDQENHAREKRLDALDRRYYKDAGDLAEPLLAFIKSNRDQIVLLRSTGARVFVDRAIRSVRRRLDRLR